MPIIREAFESEIVVFISSIFCERKKDVKSSLIRAVAKLFWKEFLLLGALCLVNDVIIRIVQPQLLRQFLLFFKSNSNISHSDAILCASGMVILNGLGALIINQLFMTGYHNGMKVRIAICSLIYRKVYIAHESQSLCRPHFLKTLIYFSYSPVFFFLLLHLCKGSSFIACCPRNNVTGESNQFDVKRCESL